MTTTNAHAWAAGKLLSTLDRWSENTDWRFLPEGTGVHLDEINGAVPDVVGFSPDQTLHPEATYNEPPFLVAEVLSRSTAKTDRTRKRQRYAAIGVQLYLIIDAGNRTVEVFRLQDGVYGAPEVLGENEVWQPNELPELRLEVARLWM